MSVSLNVAGVATLMLVKGETRFEANEQGLEAPCEKIPQFPFCLLWASRGCRGFSAHQELRKTTASIIMRTHRHLVEIR